ncbi:MAG: ATP-binding protein [Chitinispirillaceae bacterium]|nr:ATP-binding protein [Chitinispirillaceae bacterium]
MLIEFEVGNYLSFKKPVRLSLVAANTDKELLECNTFEVGRYRLLRSAAIYGANASGKSNLLSALNFMAKFVTTSSRESTAQDEINVIPFKLDYDTENEPSRFETTFLIGNTRYRYGFEATRKQIVGEWLFCSEKIKEKILFLRTQDGIDVRPIFNEGSDLESKTRDNALFLSVVAQFNGTIAKEIFNWFTSLICMYGNNDQSFSEYTAKKLLDEEEKSELLDFIKESDLGIEDIKITELDDNNKFRLAGIPPRNNDIRLAIFTVHKKFRQEIEDGFSIMDLTSEESEGTKKFFRFAGPIFTCIKWGLTVCFDELDAKLHPLLTRAIVRLFNSPANKHNAQLIFTTHDTNLLQAKDLRRDQIWFTEKDQTASTDLYSLAEFKNEQGSKIRKDAAYENNYIQGRYGAIPFLGDFGAVLKGNTTNG